jgi:divalent metal cation (Fe/Co/Zn/Cd) transporter
MRARAANHPARSRPAGTAAPHRDALTVSRRPTGRHRAAARRAHWAALLGNAALALLKGIAAAFTGSAAMLAETFHSISDTGNQVLLLMGIRWARRPADAAHPFGHGKNVYFWS